MDLIKPVSMSVRPHFVAPIWMKVGQVDVGELSPTPSKIGSDK